MEKGFVVTFRVNAKAEMYVRNRLALAAVNAYCKLEGGRIVEKRDNNYVRVCRKKAEKVAFALLQHLARNMKNSPECIGNYVVELPAPRNALGVYYRERIEEGLARVRDLAR